LFTFAFGEVFGRRRTIMLGCTVLCLGAAIQTSSYGIPQLIVGRIVTGLGNGMNTSTVPVWHSETTKAHNRGKALGIELAINIFGVMLSYWIDYGMSFVRSPAQFRLPIALQMVFAIATVILILFCPESPRWLLKHGREDEAFAVLQQLSVQRSVGMEASVEAEFSEIKAALAAEEAATLRGKNGKPVSAMRACFTNGKERYFHRVMLGVGSQFMQQLCGINLITYCKLFFLTNARNIYAKRLCADRQMHRSSFSSLSVLAATFHSSWPASTVSLISCHRLCQSG
jgi:MFS family permease